MSTGSAGWLKCLSNITGNFQRLIQGSHSHRDLEISGNFRIVISRPVKTYWKWIQSWKSHGNLCWKWVFFIVMPISTLFSFFFFYNIHIILKNQEWLKMSWKQQQNCIAHVNLSSCAEIHFLWLELARNVMDIEKIWKFL